MQGVMHGVACMVQMPQLLHQLAWPPHLSFNDSWHSCGAVTAATAWCTRSTRPGRSPASSAAPRVTLQANPAACGAALLLPPFC